jgi:hypothetical protein
MADPAAIAQAIIQAAAAAGPGPAPIVVPFARLPGDAFVAPLDYNKSSDMKTFRAATEPLAEKFDLKPENLNNFLVEVRERSRIYNWSDVLNVPDDDGDIFNLIDSYGQITLEECVNHATTYIDNQSQQGQNSMILYIFLRGSLTEHAKTIVMSEPDAYSIDGEPSGSCFLKVIIGKGTIDTIATENVLRTAIGTMPAKLKELGGDIRSFNLYVTQLRQALMSRGQSIDKNQILINVLIAYSTSTDTEFREYIKQKRNMYEDGAIIMTLESLMNNAVNKYDLKVQDGTWNAPDDRDATIMALQTQVKSLAKKKKTPPSPKDQYSLTPTPTVPPSNRRSVDLWKYKKPTKGETTKKMGTKTYHWCTNHEAWCIHKPSECLLTSPKSQNDDPKATLTDQQEQIVMTKAMQAIVDSEGANNESDDSDAE